MEDLLELLHHAPLFEGFTQEELSSLTPLFREKVFTRGSILFFEGDTGEECYLVKSGSVRVYRMDEVREVTLDLMRRGDFFGEMAMMQKGISRSATAEVLEPSVIYSLRRDDFMQFLGQKPTLCLRFLEMVMGRLRRANEQIYDLTFLDLRTRLMKKLHQLSELHGMETKYGIEIPVKLTHQQLAHMVGSTRESVSKLVQELQDEDLIRIKSKYITIVNREEWFKRIGKDQ